MTTKKRNPYQTIIAQHVTEKSTVLNQLQSADSNPCVARCSVPKYTFLVDPKATKIEIAAAIESIYSEFKVKVTKVNVINVPGKKRRVRGRKGFRPGYRKAIVTLEKGDTIENV